jgi:hypothetical protein
MRWRLIVGVVTVLALVVASCGDDTTDVGGNGTSTTAPTTMTADTGSTSAAPVELPASFTGVTSDTITIGVVWSDLDELREMGLVDINYGDIPLVWQTVIDDINANGGIGGRQLEMVFDRYNPVLAISVEEMCIRLTEDEEVFAVVGSLAGPALEGILCILETQETMVLGGVHRPELLERARAPWITTEWSQDRRYSALLEIYQEEGYLEGKLGLLDDHREHNGLTEDIVLPTLDRLGVELAVELTSTATGGDELALESQIGLYAERLKDEEVDTLLIVQSAIALGLPLMREAGFEGEILTVDSGSFLAGIGGFDERDPEIYAGAYGPTPFTSDDAWAMESTQECVSIFETAHPEIDVIPSADVPSGDPQWATPLLAACRLLWLFDIVGEAVGPDLTPANFEEAAFQVGTFVLPGQPFNSIAPGKLDANDGMGLGIFDPDVGTDGGLAEVLPYVSVTED